jgi:hypothetical protein
MQKITFILFFVALSLGVCAQTTGTTGYWDLRGNTGTEPRFNFIGTTDNQPLVFKTGNLERMRLLPDKAFFGIGIPTPQATLHLHYQLPTYGFPPTFLELLQLTTYNSPNGFSIFSNRNTKDLLFKQQESANFSIEGVGGGLVIAQDGKIGLGTDAPKEKLHINDGNLFLQSTGSANNRVLFDQNGTIWGIEQVNSISQGHGLCFWSALSSGNHRGLATADPEFFIGTNGSVGVGTKNPTTKLDVKGTFKATDADITNTLTTNALTANEAKVTGLLCAKEVRVQLTGNPCWPDYVFGKNYNLMPLQELEQFVNENLHLPEIPTATNVEENGIELGEMNAKLLKKVEELTLYLFQQEKKMLELQKQIDELKK